MGRLFDGVAAITLGIGEAQFEGELAMRLEAVCNPTTTEAYDLPLDESAELPQFDWRPLLRQVCADCQASTPAGIMAMKFHRAIAVAVECIAERFSDLPVVLTGGCFQNRMLTELTAERLSCHSQAVGLPGLIPPNDGGLAAGQLAVASARFGSLGEATKRGDSPCV